MSGRFVKHTDPKPAVFWESWLKRLTGVLSLFCVALFAVDIKEEEGVKYLWNNKWHDSLDICGPENRAIFKHIQITLIWTFSII